MNVDFGYDAAGDITSLTDHVRPDRSQSFTYDPVSRLQSASGGYGDLAYNYNAEGDRLSRSWTAGGVTDTQSYAYSTDFRLDSVTSSLGPLRSFGYTDSGQIGEGP